MIIENIENLLRKRDEQQAKILEATKQRDMYNDINNMLCKYIENHQLSFLTMLEKNINIITEDYFNRKIKFLIEDSRNTLTVKTLIYDQKSDSYVDLHSNSGGGLSDIVSFIIRIMFILSSTNEKVLFMDEPFIFLSKEYNELCLDILKTVNDTYGVQIVMITHETYISDIHIDNKKIINMEV